MKKTVVILCMLVLGIGFLAMPVPAQPEIIPVTASPDTLDVTLCYPDGQASQQLVLANDNDISFSMQATWQNIPYITGIVVDPISGSIDPHSLFPVEIHVSSMPSGGDPSLPVGEYDGTVIFDLFPGSIVTVPVHYSIVNCNPSPEFPSAFLPAAMIIGFLGAVLIIQKTKEH